LPGRAGFVAGVLLGCTLWAGLWAASGRAPSATASPPESPVRQAAPARPATVPWDPPGEGFIVWESNRSGRWRLWTRRLDGTGLRQLTPEAPEAPEDSDRPHCCAHVSPDGRWISYLSLEPGPERYPEGRPETGVLRLIRPDGSGNRVLAPAARAYGEHRAAVWHGPGALVYIDGEGHTVRLDVATGKSERLTTAPHPMSGWLINPGLTHAVAGVPTFSPYDPERRKVTELQALGGCQAYFTQDGRWGYWIAGAGGPIHKMDLRSRSVSVLFGKNDERMPGGQGYLYFPMLSADRRLLAFGASAGEHDHFTADYDIYVTEVDPERLEVLGPVVQVAPHPATDRFPDVYLAPVPLGVHTGEAPFTVRLTAPVQGDWNLGDGSQAQGAAVEHTWTRPGSYRVVVRSGQQALEGRVRVTAPRPPEVEGVTVRERRLVVVRFDEPVETGGLRATLASGREVRGARLEGGGRELVIELAAPLTSPDTLRLDGITDRAGRPNPMPAREIALAPDVWPVDRDGLLFLWENAGAPNRVFDPLQNVERSFPVESRGEARIDAHQRMDLGAGAFVAANEASEAVVEGARRANQLTLEVTLEPRRRAQNAPIVSLAGAGAQKTNLVLAQAGEELVLRFGISQHGFVEKEYRLGRVAPGRSTHLVVSYRPGLLAAYRDGERVVETDLQGDFFRWRPRPLVFGADTRSENPWSGFLEGIAFYGRAFGPEESRESARRSLERAGKRPEVPAVRIRGRLLARSRIPTLQDISPYREALAVYEYRVEEVIAGAAPPVSPGNVVRVAHWVILDGRTLDTARRREGETFEILLTPFARNPQLESIFISDTLPADRTRVLQFDAGR